jgi:hypothetical protein
MDDLDDNVGLLGFSIILYFGLVLSHSEWKVKEQTSF